jgi:hypothetical protein
MTKLIAVVIIALVLFGGWELFFYWERVKNEEEDQKKQATATAVVPERLAGMPSELESSLKSAENLGATGLKNWLKVYGPKLQDPRKAWIELDYCLLVSNSDPSQARRVFAEVKNRTPQSSPVWPRIKQLERTFE